MFRLLKFRYIRFSFSKRVKEINNFPKATFFKQMNEYSFNRHHILLLHSRKLFALKKKRENENQLPSDKNIKTNNS